MNTKMQIRTNLTGNEIDELLKHSLNIFVQSKDRKKVSKYRLKSSTKKGFILPDRSYEKIFVGLGCTLIDIANVCGKLLIIDGLPYTTEYNNKSHLIIFNRSHVDLNLGNDKPKPVHYTHERVTNDFMIDEPKPEEPLVF